MNSRNKGKRGELELARTLSSYGYECRRGVQYHGGQDSPDVTGLPHIHIECKRIAERLDIDKAWSQSVGDAGSDIPTVMYRKDHADWMVLMRLSDWIELYREWEAGHDSERSEENHQAVSSDTKRNSVD